MNRDTISIVEDYLDSNDRGNYQLSNRELYSYRERYPTKKQIELRIINGDINFL